MAHAETDQLTETFKRALDDILARVFVSASAPDTFAMAVAYSGGLDSSALLHLAQDYAVVSWDLAFRFSCPPRIESERGCLADAL